MGKYVPIMDKIRAKTVEVDSCWIWTGPKNRKGYGMVCSRGKTYFVHRAAWTHLRGQIPDGLVLDHVCRHRACWNPDHLRVVTQHENVLAGVGWAGMHARKTHCPAGHPYPPFTPSGVRRCLTCRRRTNAEAQARRKLRLQPA